MPLLYSCAAIHVAIDKRNLNVQTKITHAIFPEIPKSTNAYRFYLDIRNSTGKPALNAVAYRVRRLLMKKGYVHSALPQDAHFVLQAHIVSAEQQAKSAANSNIDARAKRTTPAGAGDRVIGAIAVGGAAAAEYEPAPFAAGALFALLGGTLSTVMDAAARDVTYTIIADLQLTEPMDSVADEQTKHHFIQGSDGKTTIAFGENRKRKRVRTKIIGTANQVNLTWDKAAPLLTKEISRAIAGTLPALPPP